MFIYGHQGVGLVKNNAPADGSESTTVPIMVDTSYRNGCHWLQRVWEIGPARRPHQPPEMFHLKLAIRDTRTGQYVASYPRNGRINVYRGRSQAATLHFVLYPQVSHLEAGQFGGAVSTILVYDRIRYLIETRAARPVVCACRSAAKD